MVKKAILVKKKKTEENQLELSFTPITKGLRDYQKDIVNEVFLKNDNVLVVLPTGGGKTVIAKEIIHNLKERVLFIVPKLELIRQSSEEFGEETDIIWSSHTMLNGNHIIVASKQTLHYRDLSKIFEDEEISVIVDEVHIGLQTLKKCLSGVNVKRIIGLTATPERMDGMSFVLEDYCKTKLEKKNKYDYAVFHRVIDKWCIQALQELNWLSPLHVILNPDAENLSRIKTKHAYDDELDSDTIRDNMGDSFYRFIDKAREFKGKPTIIFTPDLKTLDVIEETLRKSNLNYEHVDGTMPVNERKIILDKLENGDIDGVINCGVLTTGFDMPKVKQCILIRHIRSKSLLFQIVGRFIRPYNGETAEIYDFAGACYNFATAAVPNIFEAPVQWRYEGFDTKNKKKDDDELKETEELKECLDDVNVTWTDYLKDPVKTLLNSLLFYKESFEEQLMIKSKEVGREIAQEIAGKQVMELKAAFNSEVNKNVQKQVNKLKNEMLQDKQKVIEDEIKKRLTLTPGALRSWFSVNGFEWFRHYYPIILRHYEYNHSEEYIAAKREFDSIDDRHSMDEFYKIHGNFLKLLDDIKSSTIRKIPIDGLEEKLKIDKELSSVFEDLYDERTDWWLSNFILEGGFRNSQNNTPAVQQQPIQQNNIRELAASALA